MSRRTRTLPLVAGALLLATATAVQAHPADQAADRRAETAWAQRRAAAAASERQQAGEATVRRLLARERSTVPAPASSPVRAPDTGGPAWPTPALAVLAVLVGGTGLAVRRAARTHRLSFLGPRPGR